MTREDRARLEVRGRAWSLAAALPDGLDPATPIEELAVREDVEVIVVVRRRGSPSSRPPTPPPLGVISLEPIQRFLPGCFLSDVERAVVDELLKTSERMTFTQLRDPVEERVGHTVGEGVFKMFLSRLTAPEVGILDNNRTVPQGYQVTEGYKAFLFWLESVSKEIERQQRQTA